jgi:endonuclease-3
MTPAAKRKSAAKRKTPDRKPAAGRKPTGTRARRAARPAPDPGRALAVLKRLKREFPGAKCALEHETPHQLLVATILSAQCTDARVNLVTRDLFRKYPDAAAFAAADPAELERDVKSTGFFRMKARALREMSQDVLTKHGGEVPRTMEDLTALRGVGRKTANVVLGNAFGIPGLVVDTHVRRLSNRLGFTAQQDPVRIETELCGLFPRTWWTLSSHLLILHGRATCKARRPACPECAVRDLCPSADRV